MSMTTSKSTSSSDYQRPDSVQGLRVLLRSRLCLILCLAFGLRLLKHGDTY